MSTRSKRYQWWWWCPSRTVSSSRYIYCKVVHHKHECYYIWERILPSLGLSASHFPSSTTSSPPGQTKQNRPPYSCSGQQKVLLIMAHGKQWCAVYLSHFSDLIGGNWEANVTYPLTTWLRTSSENLWPFPNSFSKASISTLFPLSSMRRLMRPKWMWFKFFSHSKYETVTPPCTNTCSD